jgi:GntR family transcriptional regulator
MNIQLDFHSDLPIYIQIIEQVRQQIASGKLKPGDQLPTVRALAADLRVNFNTVARSYRLLDEARAISTQQGRGTYILKLPPPEVSERLRQEAMEAIARRYFDEAERLGFSVKDSQRILKEQVPVWKEQKAFLEKDQE